MKLLKEFKPALLFLAKFLAVYFIGNIAYGLYIESYDALPDPVTRVVAAQSTVILNVTGHQSEYADVPGARKVGLSENGRVILNVFEGCNGINVMIVFVAFLIAFGGPLRRAVIFSLGGILIIHACNLLRIDLLFRLALNNSSHFYYYHKYVFTASLYLVVFGLWAFWVSRYHEKQVHEASS